MKNFDYIEKFILTCLIVFTLKFSLKLVKFILNRPKNLNSTLNKLSFMVEEVTLDNYNVLNDFLFFKYICETGNEKQQITFLKAIGVNIKGNLRIIGPTIHPKTIKNKKSILDFFAETSDSYINIELQQKKTFDFNERIAYYMN